MSCTRPSLANYSEVVGEVSFSKHLPFDALVEFPCGKCPHCQEKYSKTWAQRMYAETVTTPENCMITFTYDDEHLPEGANLVPDHVTEFIRELRRTHKFSYYYCGEYGDRTSRPHYHMACFGQDFCEIYLRKSKTDGLLFTSNLLSELWSRGDVIVNELTPASAGYIAGYVSKKQKGDHKGYASADYDIIQRVLSESLDRYKRGAKSLEAHNKFVDNFCDNFEFRHPEFARMSTRPAIGKAFFDKYWQDMYPNDEFVDANGFVSKPCRYFDKLLEKKDPELFKQVKYKRIAAMQSRLKETWRRREDREAHKTLIKKSERNYE